MTTASAFAVELTSDGKYLGKNLQLYQVRSCHLPLSLLSFLLFFFFLGQGLTM